MWAELLYTLRTSLRLTPPVASEMCRVFIFQPMIWNINIIKYAWMLRVLKFPLRNWFQRTCLQYKSMTLPAAYHFRLTKKKHPFYRSFYCTDAQTPRCCVLLKLRSKMLYVPKHIRFPTVVSFVDWSKEYATSHAVDQILEFNIWKYKLRECACDVRMCKRRACVELLDEE